MIRSQSRVHKSGMRIPEQTPKIINHYSTKKKKRLNLLLQTSGWTKMAKLPHHILTGLSPNGFSRGYKYSHSTRGFRYYNYPFGYDAHQLLGSARLPVTAEISCQYLASCLAPGCGPSLWIHCELMNADIIHSIWLRAAQLISENAKCTFSLHN